MMKITTYFLLERLSDFLYNRFAIFISHENTGPCFEPSKDDNQWLEGLRAPNITGSCLGTLQTIWSFCGIPHRVPEDGEGFHM